MYVGVAVKKQAAQGSAQPKLIVTTDPVEKPGSQITTKALPICPYRYYGQIAEFRVLLCRWWESGAASKIKEFLFNKALDILREIYNLANQGTQSGTGGLLGISGPQGNVLLAGLRSEVIKDLGTEKLKDIYKQVVEGKILNQPWLTTANPLATQFLFLILDFIKDLTDIWLKMSAEERENLEKALADIFNAVDPATAAGDLYNGSKLNNASDKEKAFGKFIDAVTEVLLKGLQSDRQLAQEEALRMVSTALTELKKNSAPGLRDYLISAYGPVAIVALAKLVELRDAGLLSTNYAFPGNIIAFFEELRNLASQGVSNLDQLMQYLAAAVYQAAQYGGSADGERGLEGVARATLLIENIFPTMIQHGWKGMTFLQNVEGLGSFAFYGILYSDDGGVSVGVVGFIEPYLKPEDVAGVLADIERGAKFISGKATFPYVVQFIDKADPQALSDLCSNLPKGDIPEVVVRPDGKIECFANTDTNGAMFICQLMGLPNCRYTPPPSPPDTSPPGSGSASMTVIKSGKPTATCNTLVQCLVE